MGEASASQLRIWHHGLPSLVTRTGWYGTLPENTVAFVRPDNEAEDIHEHLTGFLSDPQRYRELGENGRSYLHQHHTFETYVDALIELVNAAIEFRPHWSATYWSRRAGGAMSPWFKDNAADMFLRNPSQAVFSVA